MATTDTSVLNPDATASANIPYLEWGPILGGAAIAAAASVVLGHFGTTVGLAASEPVLSNGNANWTVLPAGLWLVWMALASSAAGAYVAGRMRVRLVGAAQHEAEFRDGVHGLVVWAVATLLASMVIAIIAALAALGGIGSAAAAEEVTSQEAARIASNITVITGFATAAGAALGAAAAWWAAVFGGQHRDDSVDVNTLLPSIISRRSK